MTGYGTLAVVVMVPVLLGQLCYAISRGKPTGARRQPHDTPAQSRLCARR
jgi:hypothetical protein